jgi:hypothetical protein
MSLLSLTAKRLFGHDHLITSCGPGFNLDSRYSNRAYSVAIGLWFSQLSKSLSLWSRTRACAGLRRPQLPEYLVFVIGNDLRDLVLRPLVLFFGTNHPYPSLLVGWIKQLAITSFSRVMMNDGLCAQATLTRKRPSGSHCGNIRTWLCDTLDTIEPLIKQAPARIVRVFADSVKVCSARVISPRQFR